MLRNTGRGTGWTPDEVPLPNLSRNHAVQVSRNKQGGTSKQMESCLQFRSAVVLGTSEKIINQLIISIVLAINHDTYNGGSHTVVNIFTKNVKLLSYFEV